MVANTDYLIDCQGASVRYPLGGGEWRTVLDGINLRVKPGELTTVVGPSGCGKSTLLRLILGSQFPNDGAVFVGGDQVERVSRRCGIVFQNYTLFDHMTVLENVMCGPIWEHTGLFERTFMGPLNYLFGAPIDYQSARTSEHRKLKHRWLQGPYDLLTQNVCAQGLSTAYGWSRNIVRRQMFAWQQFMQRHLRYLRIYKETREHACEILQTCGLDPKVHGDKYPGDLSGGMRQRVAIGRAIIMKPQVLLMDEPFSGLDQITREQMQEFVHEQWERGVTIFFVTHNLDEAVKLGTRLICLSQHWSYDDGKPGNGARIIMDRQVEGGSARPSEFAASPEFHETVELIKKRGLEATNRQPVSSFMLTHPDACPSATQESTNE